MQIKPISEWQWIPWEIRYVICSDPWEMFWIWDANYHKTDAQKENWMISADAYSRWNPNPYVYLFLPLRLLDLLMRSGSDA